MRTLFIDLASHDGRLALVDGDRVVASVPVDHRIGDKELMPLFETLLRNAGRKNSDIERIACVIGPGGFTSLRVAAAFANALSFSLDVPAAGVHLWELYAVRCTDKDAVWVHSTKKEELFIRSVTDKCITWSWPEPTHTTVQEAIEGTPKQIRFCGELIPEHQKRFEEAGFKSAPVRPVEEVLPAFLETLSYKKETIKPWYGRSW